MMSISGISGYSTVFQVHVYNDVYFNIYEPALTISIDNYECRISSRKGKPICESCVLNIWLGRFETEEEANAYCDKTFIPRFGLLLTSNGASYEVTNKRTDKASILGMHISVSSKAHFLMKKLISWDISPVSDLVFDEKARTALSLVNSAIKLQKTPGAVLLLISALEALCETNRRTDAEVSVIDDVKRYVKFDARLTKDQRERMENALDALKNEGSRSACRRVVKLYGSKSGYSVSVFAKQACDCESQQSVRTEVVIPAEELFKTCYELRNDISHGREPREDFLNYEIPLRRLVVDVLEGYLKDHKKQE